MRFQFSNPVSEGNLDRLSAEEQAAADALAEAVASDLAAGVKRRQIAQNLVDQGWDAHDADDFVLGIERAIEEYRASPEGRKLIARKYLRHMIFGHLWIIGGTTVWS